jgi:hypothetical protein
VLDAVASRVCAMVRRVGIEGEVVLIGGMVHNAGFVQSLKTAMGVDAVSPARHARVHQRAGLRPDRRRTSALIPGERKHECRSESRYAPREEGILALAGKRLDR